MAKRDFPTRVNGILAHITWTPHTDRPITLTGTAIYASDGVRVDGIKTVRRQAKAMEDIAYTQTVIVNIITEAIELQRREKRKADLSEKTISRVFYKLFGNELNGKERTHIIYSWRKTTQYSKIKYFERNILPAIEHIDDELDFTEVELKDLFDTLVKKALENGRSKYGIEGANRTANDHLADAARIYEELREEEPSLPRINLKIEFKVSQKKNEQLKSIPYHIHKKFREQIISSIPSHPYMARAAVLMDSAGARSAEAAATWSECHIDYSDFMVVKITHQEVQGKRCEQLKTAHAYRCVTLDEWGTNALRMCNHYIGDDPFTVDCPVSGSELSAWVRDKLEYAGCTDAFMAEAAKELELHPDFDDNGKPVRDIAAYVCRRHRASIWRNICAYTQAELDYALGHKPQSKKRYENDNPLSKATFEKLALKNSRYDMYPDISINPQYRPISLSYVGQRAGIQPFKEVRISNSTSQYMRLKIDITAMEAGENIELVLMEKSTHNLVMRSIENVGNRMHGYVIGTINLKKNR